MNVGFVSLREQATYFALLELPSYGEVRVEKLIAEFNSAIDVWSSISANIDSGKIEHFAARVYEIEAEILQFTARGIRCVSIYEREYPENLRHSRFLKRYLFGYGNLAISTAVSVAVIGTSSADATGLRNVDNIVVDAVGRGYVIISGLARGIDAAAHRAALRAGGFTVAVVGTGLGTVYPPENRDLLIELTKTGAAFSKYLPTFKGARWSFPERNKVMAGMACATIVMESKLGSGSLLQAKSALSDRQPVFIHRSNLELPENFGWIDELMKRGAILFSSFDEVHTELQNSRLKTEEYLF